MVDPAVLTMIKDIVTILGVISGFTYYVMTVRATQKNQQLSSMYDIMSVFRDEGMYRIWKDALQYEWIDWDDFNGKYWAPEEEPKWVTMMLYYDGLGYLWKKGVLNLKDISKYLGYGCILYWRKFKPIVEVIRKEYNKDSFCYYGEFEEALEVELKGSLPLLNNS